MVPFIPFKGRGLRENFPRTRERVSARYNHRLRCPCRYRSTAFFPYSVNQVPQLRTQLLGRHSGFSEVNSGPLPSLCTLGINVILDLRSDDKPDTTTLPLLPLFGGAVNLERFVFRSQDLLLLNHFVFPNLTTFKFWTEPGWYTFQALDLLDFLEASPML